MSRPKFGPDLPENELPAWEHDLLLALGAEEDELPQFGDIAKLTIEVPTETLDMFHQARMKQVPPVTLRRYLLRCLALGLSKDLDRNYWVTRTELLVGDLE